MMGDKLDGDQTARVSQTRQSKIVYVSRNIASEQQWGGKGQMRKRGSLSTNGSHGSTREEEQRGTKAREERRVSQVDSRKAAPKARYTSPGSK